MSFFNSFLNSLFFFLLLIFPQFLLSYSISQGSPRVVGGRHVEISEFPYMAAIYKLRPYTNTYFFICGGVIYSQNFIITAAHCLFPNGNVEDKSDEIEAKNFKIVFGQTSMKRFLEEKEFEPSNSRSISSFSYHPDVKYGFIVENDIAVLKLSSPLVYSDNVKNLRIANSDESPMGLDCNNQGSIVNKIRCKISIGVGNFTGWGSTEKQLGIPLSLENIKNFFLSFLKSEKSGEMKLKVGSGRILPRALCSIRYLKIFPDNILCVGSRGENILNVEDSCSGDSGGPLSCNSPNGRYLCGIVSSGFGCGVSISPAFYVDVSKYTNWIQKHAGEQD